MIKKKNLMQYHLFHKIDFITYIWLSNNTISQRKSDTLKKLENFMKLQMLMM